jgi:hypothetical protein
MSVVRQTAILRTEVLCDGCRKCYLVITREVEPDADHIAWAHRETSIQLQTQELYNPTTGQRWLSQHGRHFCSSCRAIAQRAQEIAAQ